MFHFPGCPSHGLLIHPRMTAHYRSRVPPFGYSGIKAYLQLPRTFRSLSRPSSAISALASTLRSFSLDLASTSLPRMSRHANLPKTIERLAQLLCEFHTLALLTGIFRLPHVRPLNVFPVQFSRCGGLCPLPFAAAFLLESCQQMV